MQPPTLPENEERRLAALRALKILDTPAEERFDHIVRLVIELFDVPIAYIALVDENRQWFKSSCGLSVSETTREISFCGHAILGDEALIITDSLLDARFSDNPQVTGDPHIRFYAGYPLAIDGTYNVGTLCLADSKPREMLERDRSLLRRLAAIAQRELTLVDTIALQQQLLETRNALDETQRRLMAELAEASQYVEATLPPPIVGEVGADWIRIPCSQLGGDAFGYEWLDEHHFAMYLLDVSGHGVGAALLSTSVVNLIRSRALADTDFADPAAVLTALNDAFPMEEHGGMFFTMWYGVYDKRSRSLRYSSAGHPPAILLAPRTQAYKLGTPALVIGAMAGTAYENAACAVDGPAELFLYSDGAYEIEVPGRAMMTIEQFFAIIAAAPRFETSALNRVLDDLRAIKGPGQFEDDLSLLRVSLP